MRAWVRALLAISLSWVAAGPTQAALVGVDLFAVGDELVTRDTATDLDWLDLDQTVGLSFDDVLAGAGRWIADGWRPARTAEVCGLINSNAAAIVPCPTLEVMFVDPTAEITRFIDLLEASIVFPPEPPEVTETGLGAVGWFLASNTTVGLGGVGNTRLVQIFYGHDNKALTLAGEFDADTNTSQPDYGLFLVRPVPEPGTLALLALGLGALAPRPSSTRH